MVRGLIGAALAICLVIAPSPSRAESPYSWTTVPFGGGGFVDGFLYHPAKPGLLYARTDVGGLYRFDREGKRWVPLVDGFGHDDANCFGTLSFAVDPHDAGKLYATCGLYLGVYSAPAAVIRSNDQGRTWQKTPLPFRLGGNALGRGQGERLIVDPNDGRRLFLGTNENGLWLSTDGARHFDPVAGYPETSVSFVLVDPHYRAVYAGTNSGGGGLYRSTDDGKTFAKVPGTPQFMPHQAAIDTDGTLYVTFADGPGPHDVMGGAVWKLKPDGSWTDITPVKPAGGEHFGYSGLDLDRSHPGTLVVSSSDRYGRDDIWLSHDGGANWKPVGPQSVHHLEGYDWLRAYTGDAGDGSGGARRNMGHWMDAVKINPSDPNELIYGTGYGLWMTHDLGALDKGGMVNFDFADANFEETVILGLESPPSGARVLAAMGDVAGAGWDDVTKQPSRMFSPEYQTNQSVAYAALKPEIMARTADQAASSGFLSQDGGMSWTPMPASPRVAKDAQGRFHTSGKIAVSALGASLLWAPEGEGGYYSTDMGRTWTASAGWPAAPDRNIDPIADKMTDGVFYVFDRTSNAVLRSADGGKSFAPFVTDLPRTETHQAVQLRAVPGRAGDLWLAAGAALMHSVDGKTSPVSGVDTAWQVAFGKAAPGHDYPAVYLWGRVGGVEGLWRSDDAGRTWNRINDDAHRFGVLRAMTGDPREYGVLYIAPDGRGVMVGRPK